MSWLCERCGQKHDTTACPSWNPYSNPVSNTPVTYDHGFAYVAAIERLALAIERLALALEAKNFND